MTRLRLIKTAGYGLSAIFAAVGLIFTVVPNRVLDAFNWLSDGLDWPVSTSQSYTLYLGLAIGYMYIVTLLAWQMARNPEVRAYPLLLAHAKGASAVVCLGLFVLQDQYLLYLANFVVDGAIAFIVWWLCLRTSAAHRAGESPPPSRGGAQDSHAGLFGTTRGARSATPQTKGR